MLSAFSEGAPPSEVVRRGLDSLVRGLRGVRVSFVSVGAARDMRFLDSVTDCELEALPSAALSGADVPGFFATCAGSLLHAPAAQRTDNTSDARNGRARFIRLCTLA